MTNKATVVSVQQLVAGGQRPPGAEHRIVKSNKVVTLDCGKLRIEWQRVEDRWQHVIGVKFESNFSAYISSIEGVADDLWPMSPTFQEMHVECRGDITIMFLTGMAGASHWSASIQCEPALDCVTFDIACRCKQTPEWLGSLYQTAEGVQVTHSIGQAELALAKGHPPLIARTSEALGSVPHFSSDYRTAWTDAFVESVKRLERTLFVSPKDSASRTTRWAYSLSLAPPTASTPPTQTP